MGPLGAATVAAAAWPAVASHEALDLRWTQRDDVFHSGSWVPVTTAGRLPVTDPVTGEERGSVPDVSREELDAVVASARGVHRRAVGPVDGGRAR